MVDWTFPPEPLGTHYINNINTQELIFKNISWILILKYYLALWQLVDFGRCQCSANECRDKQETLLF
jgi:hypothetical protein